MTGWSKEDIGFSNRQRVLGEILGVESVSRAQIAERLGLNAASVSRITRDLIEARLVREISASAPESRRGPRTKVLGVENAGGYVIGIGVNAFQQMVTLADLSNNRIASWDASFEDLSDAESFLETCCGQAERLIRKHVPDRSRLFGVGVTIAGDLDKARGTVLSAPTLGWLGEVDVCEIVRRHLETPVVLETPSAAICHSEANFGVARNVANVVTIYCSLGFGFGFQLNGAEYSGVSRTGRLLTEARVTDGVASNRPVSLSELCGGNALLQQVMGQSAFQALSDRERAQEIWEVVSHADEGDEKSKQALEEFGARAASCFALTLTVLQPEMLLLAGPLAQSPYFFDAFCRQIAALRADVQQPFEIVKSEMTQMGAARLLSLSENIANAKLDLNALKGGE